MHKYVRMAILMGLLSMVLSGCATDSAGASDNPSQVSAKVEPSSKGSTASTTQSTAASGQTSNYQVAQRGTSNPESIEKTSGATVITVSVLAEIHRLNVQLRHELEKSLDSLEKEQASHAVTTAEKSLARSDLATTTASMRELAQQLADVRKIISGDYQQHEGPMEEPRHHQLPPLPKLYPTPEKSLPISPSQGDEKEGRSQQRLPDDGGYDDSVYVEPIPPSKPSRPPHKVAESVEVIEAEVLETPLRAAAPMTFNINVNPSFRDIGQIKGSANVEGSGVVRGSGNSGDFSIDSPISAIPLEDEEELPPVYLRPRPPVRVLPRHESSASAKPTTSTPAVTKSSGATQRPTTTVTTLKVNTPSVTATTAATKSASASSSTTSAMKVQPKPNTGRQQHSRRPQSVESVNPTTKGTDCPCAEAWLKAHLGGAFSAERLNRLRQKVESKQGSK